MREMTDHERYVAALMVRRGYPVDEVAALFDALPYRRPRTLTEMWADGLTMREMAEATGIDYGKINHIVAGDPERFPPRREEWI